MIKVGLTGGIGSGKSLACEVFAALDVPIIDADKISRELTTPASPCLTAIREAFGDEIIDVGGALRRDKLRHIVFSDDTCRRRLEDILHPVVREKMQSAAAALDASYCVMSVPLLVESSMMDMVDTIVVLDCPQSIQIERVAKRSGWNRAMALAVIEKQGSRKERLAAADIVIDNSGDQAALKNQINSLHATFINQAARQT